MKRTYEKTYDKEYELLLKGFECKVVPSENDGYYTVTLKENGAQVFEQEIPNVSQDLANESEEKVLNDVAQAAIDIFEAERGTLGLGAGAKTSAKRKKHMRTTRRIISAGIMDSLSNAYNYVNDNFSSALGLSGNNDTMNILREVDSTYSQQVFQLIESMKGQDITEFRDALQQLIGQNASPNVDWGYVAKYIVNAYQQAGDQLDSQATQAKRKRSMRKNATYYDLAGREDWYMQFKGTSFEPQAAELLRQYIEATYQTYENPELEAARAEEREIEKQLELLDLERMVKAPMATKIIIINASSIVKKAHFFDTECIRDFLAKFEGDPMEAQAVRLMKNFVEAKSKCEALSKAYNDNYKVITELTFQMDTLAMEVLSQDIDKKVPTEGIEAFPNMAGDIAELMQGVSLEEPLVPMSGMLASKKKRSFQEVEPVADRIIEKGIYHNGQPAEAEVPDKDMYSVGDKVSLTKEFTFMNGMPVSIPKGTKGVIESLLDESYECYSVRLMPDDSRTIVTKVPADILKKSK